MKDHSDGERSPTTDDESHATRALVHDLRSALTGIMGMAALIERTNDVGKARAWAAQIGAACSRLEARIDAIGHDESPSPRGLKPATNGPMDPGDPGFPR